MTTHRRNTATLVQRYNSMSMDESITLAPHTPGIPIAQNKQRQKKKEESE